MSGVAAGTSVHCGSLRCKVRVSMPLNLVASRILPERENLANCGSYL